MRAVLLCAWALTGACGSSSAPPDTEMDAGPGDDAAPPVTLKPSADVLFVVGGAVGPEHPFYFFALDQVADYRFSHRTAELPTLLSDRSILDEMDFRVVVVSDYGLWNQRPDLRERLTRYCTESGCGIVFLYVDGDLDTTFGVSADTRNELASVAVDSSVWLDLIDASAVGMNVPDTFTGWGTMFAASGGAAFVPLVTAVRPDTSEGPVVIGVADTADRVRSVLIGVDLIDHWFNRLILHDALSWASHRALSTSKTRYIAIDIDDAFQPNWNEDESLRTVKMQAADVDALVDLTVRLRSQISGRFRFTIGVNVGFWEQQAGDPEQFDDVAGDHRLVERRDEFDWWDHLPMHDGALGKTRAQLIALMNMSRSWAAAHGVEFINYGVTPNHQGIAALYVPLYQAWGDTGISNSSAPLNFPAFRFLGITVAPRLACGDPCDSMFSSFDDVSQESIDEFVHQVLFRRTLRDRMLIFVSHQQGYARDRIASYTFESYVTFTRQWTTLEFTADRVDKLVQLAYDQGLN